MAKLIATLLLVTSLGDRVSTRTITLRGTMEHQPLRSHLSHSELRNLGPGRSVHRALDARDGSLTTAWLRTLTAPDVEVPSQRACRFGCSTTRKRRRKKTNIHNQAPHSRFSCCSNAWSLYSRALKLTIQSLRRSWRLCWASSPTAPPRNSSKKSKPQTPRAKPKRH